MQTPSESLFVYGSLAPEQENHWVLARLNGCWQPATACGELLPEGNAETYGYPAFIPNTAGEKVAGLLFQSNELNAHWPRIDAFEGSGYRRQRILVHTQSGEAIESYVYGLREPNQSIRTA